MDETPENIAKAHELNDLWAELEKTMSEHAAYVLACERLKIDPIDGYDYLDLISAPDGPIPGVAQ